MIVELTLADEARVIAKECPRVLCIPDVTLTEPSLAGFWLATEIDNKIVQQETEEEREHNYFDRHEKEQSVEKYESGGFFRVLSLTVLFIG